jgi:E3 ubiquitin-protein ligase SHPRH
MDSQDFNAGVEAFKEEADEHVALLLNIKQGGQGLTLNEATHMFLADPLLSDAQRAQVISRIHRVGQTRETTVHDYVTVKTVEEAIDKHLGVSSSSLSQFTASSAHGTRLTIKDLMTLLFPKNDWS